LTLKISALCVDNGEELARECLESIRSQGVDEVVVVAGPRTNIELVKKYADIVIGPITPVGWGRYIGLLNTSNKIVAFCDTDTVYMEGYFKYALEDFEKAPDVVIVKAGTVEPHSKSILGALESTMLWITGAFEYGWVVDKDKLLRVMSRDDVEALKNDKADFGIVTMRHIVKSIVDHRMRVKTRLPGYYFKNYFIPIVGTLSPIVASSGLVIGGAVLGKKM